MFGPGHGHVEGFGSEGWGPAPGASGEYILGLWPHRQVGRSVCMSIERTSETEFKSYVKGVD